MKHDIVLAGVGGQGILTIARVLCQAAMNRGLHVKQAEVHGMSQRGGAVYSHLRISENEIFSDIIPQGQADLVISVEPLEALRYKPLLRHDGTVVASTDVVANIADYPPVERVLDHIAEYDRHVTLDMNKLGRAAGSPLSANIVALGAASHYMGFSVDELEHSIEELFAAKGERAVSTNIRAFRLGRTAAAAYTEGIQRGATPSAVRHWIETLPPESLASEDSLDFDAIESVAPIGQLSPAEAHAFESILMNAYEEGRRQLFEHEVYSLIQLVGAISPPRHTLIPKGSMIPPEILERYPGETVVVKLVSTEIVHKSDVGAVQFVPKTVQAVRTCIDSLFARLGGEHVAGVLLVEYVEPEARGIGGELFVGIRSTREFGPVIAAGLGGTETEYLASRMKPGAAVAKAVAMETDAEAFLELFRTTAAYDLLSGNIRGHRRLVSDHELLRCFRSFLSIANHFCVDRGEEGPDIGELEVNPFAFRNERLLPLDGRGYLRPAARARKAAQRTSVSRLIEPASIALLGVSSKPEGLGRIILQNTLDAGFSPEHLTLIRKDAQPINGIKAVGSISDLANPVDLLVVTAPAGSLPSIARECNATGNVLSAILISGGAGETAASADLAKELDAAIAEEKQTAFLGPNCMGVRSKPGMYDTFFIPKDKIEPRTGPTQPLALISQSGAFVVSRLSSLPNLNPSFAISIGNQSDLTVSDFLWALADRADVRVAGVYLEGFADLDGLETVRAVSHWKALGKRIVFYKGGRTDRGRSAAAGHTAAVAGDYDICQNSLLAAGVLWADDFRSFGQLLQTCLKLDGKKIGPKIFAVTNAGMEAVAISDTIPELLPKPTGAAESRFTQILEDSCLSGLVETRNPLDLTPMAGERVYGAIVQAALASEEVDAVIVSCVPLAPQLETVGEDLEFTSLAQTWGMADKPVVFVLDAGALYDPLAASIDRAGLSVFRSVDEAARTLRAIIG